MQLLRKELRAQQIEQVAKSFMLFAFKCAKQPSVGNPEDEFLEFRHFYAVARNIPGISLVLSVDVSTSFEDEKELIMATLAQLETQQAAKDAAAKEDKKADSKM